eukprot:2020330-Alexandrium_andersonii.AAC.1
MGYLSSIKKWDRSARRYLRMAMMQFCIHAWAAVVKQDPPHQCMWSTSVHAFRVASAIARRALCWVQLEVQSMLARDREWLWHEMQLQAARAADVGNMA